MSERCGQAGWYVCARGLAPGAARYPRRNAGMTDLILHGGAAARAVLGAVRGEMPAASAGMTEIGAAASGDRGTELVAGAGDWVGRHLAQAAEGGLGDEGDEGVDVVLGGLVAGGEAG